MQEQKQYQAFNAHYSDNLNFALLTWHCFIKGIQIGAMFGTFILPPIYYLRCRQKAQKFQFAKITKYQLGTMGVGTILSLGMMLYSYYGWNNKSLGLKERVYRIHNNKLLVRKDFFAGTGFISLFGLGLLLNGSIVKSIGLSSFGIAGGLLAHSVTKPANQE